MKNKLFWGILCSFIVLAYGQRFVKVANNLADLALLNPNDVHTNVFVAGGSVAGDGNGGVFSYIRDSTTATTAVDVIKPVSYAGRWLRSIPGMNFTNGPGMISIGGTTNLYITTNVLTYFTNSYTTNITLAPVTQVVNYITNLNVTNLTYNIAQRGTEQISGTNATINFTNQFLKRWVLSGNSFPVFSSLPSGTNETQVQVDVVQPAGAAYTITWPGVINWRKNSGYELLEQDTTNTFIFQWNGEGTSGWLVDGDANSAFLASGGQVQRIGSGTDFTMQDDAWVDVTFASAMSVTITNNGPYAVYYSSQIGAANSQAFYLRLYDGTNAWDGTFSEDTTESVPIPAMRLITTNVTTAPVTLTLQTYNPATAYPNAYVISTNTVLGYHLLGGGSGGGGISYTTITNAFSLTTGYLPYATGANALGDSPLVRVSATEIGVGSLTNLLKRNGSDLVYSNSYQYPTILVYGSGGVPAYYGLSSGTAGDAAQITGPTGVNVGWGINQISIYSTNLIPNVTANFGSASFPFGNLWLAGKVQTTLAGTTNFLVTTSSGYTGAGTKYLSDDGTYKAGTGLGTTINSTDGYLPYRVNGTTFGDSPWYRISTNGMGFNTTNMFMWVDDTLNNQGEGLHTLNLGALSGSNNTSYGPATLYTITSGSFNTAFGFDGLTSQNTGDGSTAVGAGALHDTDSNYNTGIGYRAGYTNTTSTTSVYIGYNANPKSATGENNQIVIGANAVGQGANTATIGTNGITVLYLNGTVGWFRGSGSPEAAVTANVGSFYSREDGGVGTSFYVKETGSGNTGWAAK